MSVFQSRHFRQQSCVHQQAVLTIISSSDLASQMTQSQLQIPVSVSQSRHFRQQSCVHPQGVRAEQLAVTLETRHTFIICQSQIHKHSANSHSTSKCAHTQYLTKQTSYSTTIPTESDIPPQKVLAVRFQAPTPLFSMVGIT